MRLIACEYHFVWVPKYRYQVLVSDIKSRLKEILAEVCEWLDVNILEGAKPLIMCICIYLFPQSILPRAL